MILATFVFAASRGSGAPASRDTIWIGLALPSWEAWCEKYLATKVSKPTKAGRVELIKKLKGFEMTHREIGAALGVNASQITRTMQADGITEDEGSAAPRAPKTIDERLESAIKAVENLLSEKGAEIQASQSAMARLAILRSKIVTALPAGK